MTIRLVLASIVCFTATILLAMEPFMLYWDGPGQSLTWSNPVPGNCMFRIETSEELGTSWDLATNVFLISRWGEAAVPMGPSDHRYYRCMADVAFDSWLRLYYRFAGDVQDGSGNGNNGTPYGPVLAADRFGHPDNAMDFDGVSDWLSAPDSPSLDLTNACTIAAWLFPRDATVDALLVHKINSYGLHYDAGEPPSGQDRMILKISHDAGGLAWTEFALSYTLRTNQWQHVAAVYSPYSGICSFFVDGAFIGHSDTVQAMTIPNSSGPLAVGGYSTVRYFNGLMDDVCIFEGNFAEPRIRDLSEMRW